MELQKVYPEIQALGGELLVISVEPQEQSRAGKEELGLTFPILADEAHAVSESYKVYNLLGDNLAAPAVFVIDREGRISWRYVGRDVADRPAARTVVSQLRKAAG